MRILVMVNNFPWAQSIDGIFNWLHLRALRDRGHQIRVLRWAPWAPPLRKRWMRYRSIPGEYVHDEFPVRTLRMLIGPANYGIGSIRLQSRVAVADEIASFSPDVVQVHGLLPAGVMALNATLPYVLTGHGSETYRSPFVRQSLRHLAGNILTHASACVGVSSFVADRLRVLGARDPHVIFNGADDAVFFPRDRRAARAALGFDSDAPTVLYAGHLIAQKGVRELVDAAIALRELGVQFIFAGYGVLGDELRADLAAAKVRAVFPGLVAHDVLATMYAAADVVALPSYAEGLPLLLCEAMCAGRAIVATRVGGIPEIVHDGRTGYIVEPRDAVGLTRRLRDVLTDALLQRRFERAAAAFAREHLTWKANALAYETLYRRLLERGANVVNNVGVQ